jgi:hypothetical protein
LRSQNALSAIAPAKPMTMTETREHAFDGGQRGEESAGREGFGQGARVTHLPDRT